MRAENIFLGRDPEVVARETQANVRKALSGVGSIGGHRSTTTISNGEQMPVRLKFRVSKKSESMGYVYRDGKNSTERVGSVELYPVSDGSEENKQFYAATPSGRIEFATINQAALDSLPLNAECYITIEPIPAQSDEAAA